MTIKGIYIKSFFFFFCEEAKMKYINQSLV